MTTTTATNPKPARKPAKKSATKSDKKVDSNLASIETVKCTGSEADGVRGNSGERSIACASEFPDIIESTRNEVFSHEASSLSKNENVRSPPDVAHCENFSRPSGFGLGEHSSTELETDFHENGNKKRGRKPRGGKLILRNTENSNIQANVSNIILHLKCSMTDLTDYNTTLSRMMTDPLEYNPEVPPEVLTYNDKQGFTSFDESATTAPSSYTQLCKCCMTNMVDPSTKTHSEFSAIESEIDTTNVKDINQKLKTLKIQLYKNSIPNDKKAACFWCTYDFDNTACLIPKYEMDDTIYGYGSFCRPECAVAYLMKENIDDSTKFERYQLLNQIYSKVYGCKKNIKPAPNPYYLLEKYYGNLTIQEYRKLLKTEHLMLVIDKPLTRILPELHEDNEDMIMNIYGINKSTEAVSGVYKVKRQSEKQQGPSKASIIRNKFGLA